MPAAAISCNVHVHRFGEEPYRRGKERPPRRKGSVRTSARVRLLRSAARDRDDARYAERRRLRAAVRTAVAGLLPPLVVTLGTLLPIEIPTTTAALLYCSPS